MRSATHGLWGISRDRWAFEYQWFWITRSAYENAGYRTRDITRLSDRVKRSEAIVWTPKVLHPIPGEVTEWMESWLGRGGKTLVFILPDSGSEVDYWADATGLASIEQRTEYRRREVRGINQQLQWRLNRWDWDANGWFQVKPLAQRQPLVIDNSEQNAKRTAKAINSQSHQRCLTLKEKQLDLLITGERGLGLSIRFRSMVLPTPPVLHLLLFKPSMLEKQVLALLVGLVFKLRKIGSRKKQEQESNSSLFKVTKWVFLHW